jgi:transposase-like protein
LWHIDNNKEGHRIAAEVKADIIRRVKEEGVSVSQAAKDHGISTATIYTWLGTGASGSPSWSEFSRLEKQNRELLEVIGELTVKLSAAQKKN